MIFVVHLLGPPLAPMPLAKKGLPHVSALGFNRRVLNESFDATTAQYKASLICCGQPPLEFRMTSVG
jgi:hypothetical protein